MSSIVATSTLGWNISHQHVITITFSPSLSPFTYRKIYGKAGGKVISLGELVCTHSYLPWSRRNCNIYPSARIFDTDARMGCARRKSQREGFIEKESSGEGLQNIGRATSCRKKRWKRTGSDTRNEIKLEVALWLCIIDHNRMTLRLVVVGS